MTLFYFVLVEKTVNKWLARASIVKNCVSLGRRRRKQGDVFRRNLGVAVVDQAAVVESDVPGDEVAAALVDQTFAPPTNFFSLHPVKSEAVVTVAALSRGHR